MANKDYVFPDKQQKRKKLKPKERRRVLEQLGNKCSYCGKLCKQNDIHLDHVIPISRGGGADRDNLAAACCMCNITKYDLFIEDFFDKVLSRRNEIKKEMRYYNKVIRHMKQKYGFDE